MTTENTQNGSQHQDEEFEKVDSTFADAWKPEKPGDHIKGLYLGSQEAMGDRGPFTAYHLMTDDNKRLSVSGANLNSFMSQVPARTRVVITYMGKERQKMGEMRVFDVKVAKGTRLIDPFADVASKR